MDNTNKHVTRNILSVVTGVLTAVSLFLIGGLILLLNIASKVKGHGEESNLGNISLAGFFLLFICCFSGGFVTGKISTKNDWIPGTITGIVLLILFLIVGEFTIDKESILSLILIIPITLFGNLVAIRIKKKGLQ